MNVRLKDPAFYLDPHDAYRRLRDEEPVWWDEEAKVWAVSRHADVMAVSRDPKTFCNGKGVLLTDRERGVAATNSVLYLDPPEHQQHRKLVNPGFHPHRLVSLEPRVRELAKQIVDGLPEGEVFDLVEEVAVPLPLLVIADMLGIPGDDRDAFKKWSDLLIEAATEFTEENMTAALELFQYFAAVIEERRGQPGDDMISVLINGEVEGERLTEAELLGFCMTLLVAGNETTRNLISGGTRALAEHPDQLARLVADLDALPVAVDELLRWVTPVMSFARTATCDTQVGDQAVREGDFVLLLYTSANRDERAFGDTADQLDLWRSPNPHVGFGFGEHFCLGANLARMETRVMFDELLRRFPRIELAGEPDRLPSVLMNSLQRLPVVLSS
ncbi:MAG: cytochrome P450 [Actinobacteria bacterium]|nr:cytochrome P450 [Actinomycetota bacterium]MBV9933204.1 cytochrome P450 [Actinomycetota bacterium]